MLTGLELPGARLDGGQERVERALGAGHGALRDLQDRSGDPEAARDSQPVGATRYALEQAIGGGQRLGVELKRRVHDPHGVGGELLQGTQVSCRQRHRATTGERLQYRRR